MAKKGNTLNAIGGGPDDWQVESDMRTLMEAEKIKKDPKRMAKCQAMAKQKLLDLASVASDSGTK